MEDGDLLLTTASCSFSSSRCNSAAVRGRGCLNGSPLFISIELRRALFSGKPGLVLVLFDAAGGMLICPGEEEGMPKGSGGGGMADESRR